MILVSILLAVIVIILATGLFYFPSMLKIITGFAAKSVCSGVFIASRTIQSYMSVELNFSLVRFAKVWVDVEEKAVYSSVFGMAKRKAVFRPGLGSCLVFEEQVSKLPTSFAIDRLIQKNNSSQWPVGDYLADGLFDEVNYEQLNTAVDKAFDKDGKSDKNTRAVIVVYKDQIISEKYASGFDQNTPQLGWSLTKSLTNAILGILVKEGRLTLEQKDLLDEWKGDERSEISINHLLQMTSGLIWNEEYRGKSDVVQMLYLKNDKAKFAMDRPLKNKPGTSWVYSSGTTNILQKVIRKTFKSDEEYWQFPYQRLFEKLGMNSAILEADNTGTFVGSSYGYATPRDWTRFGLLYLQDGVWNGERILPEGWVNYSSCATEASSGNYGAHFWTNTTYKYATAPKDMFVGQGYQGQRIFIIPSKEMVIVRMGVSDDGTFDFNGFLDGILGAVNQ